MSVTEGFPRAVTDEAFAKIFAPRPKTPKYQDVVSTLSRTVDELEQPMHRLSITGQQEAASMEHDQMHKIEVSLPDGSESSISIQLNAMSGQFLPFRPPPVPLPNAAASAGIGAEQAVDNAQTHRVYKAIFTLEETTDANGEVRILAHSPTLIDEEDFKPRTFLERMALRQLRHNEAQGRPDEMIAISVKRQRKLKMKKKKYKKLMKRTRNDRRKLDRI